MYDQHEDLRREIRQEMHEELRVLRKSITSIKEVLGVAFIVLFVIFANLFN